MARKSRAKTPSPAVEKTQTSLPGKIKLNKDTFLRNKKLTAVLALLILIVVILLYLYKGLFVAAIVNGEPITRISVIKNLENQSGEAVLENLIIKKLILQEVRNKGVSATPSEIDSEIVKIEANLKSQGTTLDQALQRQSMTRNELRNEIGLQLSVQKLAGEDIKISDKEMGDYITQNKSLFPEGTTDEQKKTQARESLRQEKIQGKTQKLIEDLQKKAKIQKFVSY
ncbi:MAG: SurA N-terminal domain-containing protein [Candidatus Levybacteria bacterium]|nr:SurA N-terminal domain-containing protein [Candidatus Levybacteria bacterium]